MTDCAQIDFFPHKQWQHVKVPAYIRADFQGSHSVVGKDFKCIIIIMHK